jgi:hypothetical protein
VSRGAGGRLVQVGAAPGALAPGVAHRVHRVQGKALPLVLHPGSLSPIHQAAAERHHAAGQVAGVHFIVHAREADGGVATHAAAGAHGEGLAQLLLVEVVGCRRMALEDGEGRAPQQRGVWSAVVVHVEEGQQPHIHVVEAGHVAEEIQAALAQRTPEALHFSSGLRVIRAGVQQGGTHTGASGSQGVAAVGAAIVEVEGVGPAVAAQGAHQQPQHVHLALGVVGLEGHHVAAGVVQQGVNAQRAGLALQGEGGAVAHVAVPQGHGLFGLPAQAGVGAGRVAQGLTGEAGLAQKAAQGGSGDGARLQPPIGLQGTQQQRHRGGEVLLANVQQQLALLGGEGLGATLVAARGGRQALQPPALVGVVPPLQRGHREAARGRGSGREEALLAEGLQRGPQLAFLQLRLGEGAQHAVAEYRYRLRVGLGGEAFHSWVSPAPGGHGPPLATCGGRTPTVPAAGQRGEASSRVGAA